jgi:adenylosuccinate lyase
MAATPIDSLVLGGGYGSDVMRTVFDDERFVARMLEVEAALAQAEAEAGLIPTGAADAIAAAVENAVFPLDELRRGVDEAGHLVVPLVRMLAARTDERGRAGSDGRGDRAGARWYGRRGAGRRPERRA